MNARVEPSGLFYPRDGSEEWLSKIDAILAVKILQRCQSDADGMVRVLEVGVWKGAWASVVLMNDSRTLVSGVDPYPFEGAEDVRRFMLDRLSGLGVGGRFTLFASFDELLDQKFDVIHVDGNHEERFVEADLRRAGELLSEQGVLVVDDISNMRFPGVASAFFRFLESSGLRMFLSSGNKGYVAAPSTAARLHREFLNDLMDDPEIVVQRHWSDGVAEEYGLVQPTSVLGQDVLLARMDRTKKVVPEAPLLKRAVRQIAPPIVMLLALRMRSLIRGATRR